GANLFSLSGEMPAYDNIVLTEIDAQQGKIVLGGQEMFPGDVMNDEDEYTFRRIQIRETILSHFEKEIQLFPRGIKVLTLFFIDSVEKYRQYDGEGEQQPGEYAEIFEEEYNKLRSEQLDLFREEYNKYLLDTDPGRVHRGYMPAGYSDYLERDEAEAVHEGYFSIDKKGRAVDPKVKRGSESSDDISAYDLIMKDKERLMSLEEPVRFIFSHSALKEGWDNPNVFQICALKNPESGSETRRRQEVGRGMRLCVDNNGQRMDIESVGELVHSINKLTVVASESYEAFAKGLQNEIAASLKDRPKKVTPELFANKVVREESGKEQLLTKDQARELLYELMIQKVVDRKGDITEIGRELIEKDKLPLPEEFAPYREDITNILKSVYTGEPFRPENERNTVRLQTNQNFARKEFQELWDKISLKTIYEVRFDTEKLVQDSIVKINANLNIRDRVYEIVSGELDTHTREELESNEAIKAESRGTVQVGFNPSTTAVYDIVGEIESRTHLTRRSITRILKGLKREKFLLLKKNPEVFIARCSGFINEVKATLIFSNIVYHKTEQRHDAKTVFSNDNTTLRNAAVLKKHIYDYLATDSKTEAAFVKALEESTEVTVYARLPRSFYITTPVANYSPDWAIVFDKEKVRHIYFVAETKGSDSGLELREIEKLKIHCAGEHFKEISGNEVVFKAVSSFETLMEVVQMK
ncbi:MAG: hypothetical protein JJU35_14880, partial [Balneolales bacterium]|nr:hypothetical protein [Balneolales bacterium]